jgi:hypothetical protein
VPLADVAVVVDEEGVPGVARPGADAGGVVCADVAGGVVRRGGARAPYRAGGAGGALDALEGDEEEGEHLWRGMASVFAGGRRGCGAGGGVDQMEDITHATYQGDCAEN